MILTIAELHEYKANPNRHAYGTCLEARLHEGAACGLDRDRPKRHAQGGRRHRLRSATGRVKAIYDTLDPRKTYEAAGPATPVNITGLDTPPGAVTISISSTTSRKPARLPPSAENRERFQNLGGGTGIHVTLENLHERLTAEKAQTLNVILRADVRGSIEAILKEFGKLQTRRSAGQGTAVARGWHLRADVQLATLRMRSSSVSMSCPTTKRGSWLKTVACRFGATTSSTKSPTTCGKRSKGCSRRRRNAMSILGRALVQRTFVISRVGTVAGCRVLSGTIERNSRVRIIRDKRVVGDYGLDSLKREKDDAREVREGLECGIKLAGFNDLKEGDVLEAYKVEEVARTL